MFRKEVEDIGVVTRVSTKEGFRELGKVGKCNQKGRRWGSCHGSVVNKPGSDP